MRLILIRIFFWVKVRIIEMRKSLILIRETFKKVNLSIQREKKNKFQIVESFLYNHVLRLLICLKVAG